MKRPAGTAHALSYAQQVILQAAATETAEGFVHATDTALSGIRPTYRTWSTIQALGLLEHGGVTEGGGEVVWAITEAGRDEAAAWAGDKGERRARRQHRGICDTVCQVCRDWLGAYQPKGRDVPAADRAALADHFKAKATEAPAEEGETLDAIFVLETQGEHRGRMVSFTATSGAQCYGELRNVQDRGWDAPPASRLAVVLAQGSVWHVGYRTPITLDGPRPKPLLTRKALDKLLSDFSCEVAEDVLGEREDWGPKTEKVAQAIRDLVGITD